MFGKSLKRNLLLKRFGGRRNQAWPFRELPGNLEAQKKLKSIFRKKKETLRYET